MKIKILAIALCALFATTQINAQSNLSYGIKAEASLSKFIFDSETVTSGFGPGIGIGGFLKIDLGEYFAIQPELLFQWQNFSETTSLYYGGVLIGETKRNYELWGMEVPIYAVGQIDFETGDRIYAGIGPYFGLGFSAKIDDGTNISEQQYGDFLNRADIGIAAMAGYEFEVGFLVNVGFKYGLLNKCNKLDYSNINSIKGMSLSIGLGYIF